jgi:hypothetical protein
VSHTTRAPRGQEKHGREYFFVSNDEFDHMVQADAFLDWAHVHGLACLVLDGPLGAELPTEETRRAHLMEASAHFAALVVAGIGAEPSA